jgi:hypothetical protein
MILENFLQFHELSRAFAFVFKFYDRGILPLASLLHYRGIFLPLGVIGYYDHLLFLPVNLTISLTTF